MRALIGALAFAAFGLTTPAGAQDLENVLSDFVDNRGKKAWHADVERTERGHLIGNPDADAELIMFTSYACEGCHRFTFRGDPELDLALLAPGILSVEIRQRLNHPVDLPLALLTRCGPPEKFKVNHAMFLRQQPDWLGRWQNASSFNRDRWSRNDMGARTSLVSALDFDDLMARRRGYSRMDLNRCLNDRAAIADIRADAAADNAEFGLPTDAEGYSKPHFVLNGTLLKGVHDWDALYKVLSNQFKPDQEGK